VGNGDIPPAESQPRLFDRGKMKKYFLTNRFKLFLASIWLGPLLTLIPLFAYMFLLINEMAIFYLTMGVVGISDLLHALFMIYSEKLIVSENGVRYNSAYFSIDAKWADVVSISKRNWWFFKLDSLIVEEPEIKMKSLSSSLLVSLLRARTSKRSIPLGCFSDNWSDSELGQQLKQYAPYLFQ
jgi:hypothetical protein